METSRYIWDSPRSILGLILFSLAFLSALDAEEIFNVPFKSCSKSDTAAVESVTFYCLGDKNINIDRMIESLGNKRATILITGEKGTEGKALSADMFVDILIRRNVEKRACLVMIDAYVNGKTAKTIDTSKQPPINSRSIANQVLVFTSCTEAKEIEDAIVAYLQNLVEPITGSTSTKPTFFVLH